MKPTEQERKAAKQKYLAEYYARNKAQIAERKRALRLAKRDEVNSAARQRYAVDDAAREQKLQSNIKSRKRYMEKVATDPAVLAAHQARLAARRAKHKAMLSDPEYRKKLDAYNATQREKRRRKAAAADA